MGRMNLYLSVVKMFFYFYGHPDHREFTVIGLSGNVPYTLENPIDELILKLGIKTDKKVTKQ
jgi:hypothetical protein